jgi:HTH-type transcriptional regulator/antitoxin HigA
MKNTYNPQTITPPKDFLIEALEEHNMGPKEFAIRTGKPEKTISAILNGKSNITPEMAIQFEKALKIPAHFWLEIQRLYDECEARNAYQKNLEESQGWARKFPYSNMAKLGWVKATKKASEKVAELLTYFGVASEKAWNDCYFDKKLKISLRASLEEIKHAHALTAWLRHGQLQAQKIDAPTYSKSTFKKQLNQAKELMFLQPSDFFQQLQQLCLKAGVIVVYSPSLPSVPIHGATRWNNNTPLIQLTGRYKQNDIFWFTFFHEAGHILEHSKKYISLENISYKGEDEQFEKEADNIAIDYTFSTKKEAKFLALGSFEDNVIESFAQANKIHPAIIVGRLQHKKLIAFKEKRHFFVPINLGESTK